MVESTEPAQASTDPGVVAISRAYVVHDPTTGEIQHIHYVHTFGQDQIRNETDEVRAIRLAGRRAGKDAVVLEADLGDVAYIPNTEIAVDVNRRRIIRTKL